MSDSLKNRLVGTIIIVALVVIFLPQWLDGEKQSSQQNFLEVPEKPESLEIEAINPVDIDALKEAAETPEVVIDLQADDAKLEESGKPKEAEQSASADNEPNADKTTVDTTSKPNTPPPASGPVTSKKQQGGWVIQLGVFGNQANVQRVENQVSKAGYRVFRQSVTTEAGRLTKVLVGPELDQRKLEKILPELQRVTGLKGKITEYRVSAE